MNRIWFTDWAPCLGVSKLVRSMADRDGDNTVKFVHDFASVSVRSIEKILDFSEVINWLVDRVITQICECEESWIHELEIDGSPLSYLNFARFHGIPIRQKVIFRVWELVDLTSPITRIRLLRPDNSFVVPKALKIVLPSDYHPYDVELHRTYRQYYGPQKIETHYVGSPNQ